MGEKRRLTEDPISKPPAVSGEGAEVLEDKPHAKWGAGQDFPRNYGRFRESRWRITKEIPQ